MTKYHTACLAWLLLGKKISNTRSAKGSKSIKQQPQISLLVELLLSMCISFSLLAVNYSYDKNAAPDFTSPIPTTPTSFFNYY